MFCLLDTHGAVVSWTADVEGLSGYQATELAGLSLARLFTAGEDAPDQAGDWLSAALTAGSWAVSGWLVHKDGSRRPAHLGIQPLRAGQNAAFAASVEGIGQPRNAGIADSENQFRLLVQGVTDYAIYMLDRHGRIASWNVGGERIKGYAAGEVVGRHFSLFYTEEDRAEGRPDRALQAAARDGRFEAEGWRVRKDGTRFWAHAILDAIRDTGGKLIGFAKITRDLSEKKASEAALERARAALAQSQKMEAVGQLTGGVAHDFNNLLTAITNALDLLEAAPRDDAQRRRIIDSAQRAAGRGARLIQQLLAFARRQPLRPQVHDVNRLIAAFEAVLRRACPEPVQFVARLAPLPLAANIDAPQFETALLNLAVNARDAMPRGGRLSIATGREAVDRRRAEAMSDVVPGDYVVVAVTDTGEGMTPSVLARALEPFFTTKEVGRGSGLGLSQVYGFVRQSGGHVEIGSRPGGGTTVTLYLPLAALAAPSSSSMPDRERQIGRSLGRVLVVEDDTEVLDVAVESLHRIGYDVITAPNGPEALAILRREPAIDILFSDVVMPGGMNGIELARTASRLRPQLRVLLVSGYPTPGLPTSQARGGGLEFAFLNKPYRSAELAAALRALQDA